MSEFNLKNTSNIPYDGLLVSKENQSKVSDNIVIEAALQININNESYTVVMRTPGNDSELIRGLLYAEDIYRGRKNLLLEIIEEKSNGFSIINATIPPEKLGKGYLNKRTLLSVSSCGICGKQELSQLKLIGDVLKNSSVPTIENVTKMFSNMRKHQAVFESTGGSHAAAIFDKDYNFLTIKEDIGRHNAVDKVVGRLINENKIIDAKYMLVSGRVSYEIVSKAFFAKIPVIIAVSACSSLAIDYAKEFGICLIGFTRDHKMTIYSAPNN